MAILREKLIIRQKDVKKVRERGGVDENGDKKYFGYKARKYDAVPTRANIRSNINNMPQFPFVVEYWDIDRVIIGDCTVSARLERAIKASLAMFGQQRAVVVGKDGVVASGRALVAVMRKLQWDGVWVRVFDASPEELKKYRDIDNEVAKISVIQRQARDYSDECCVENNSCVVRFVVPGIWRVKEGGKEREREKSFISMMYATEKALKKDFPDLRMSIKET